MATEDERLQQACDGDEKAWGDLLKLHTPELRRVVAGKLSAKWQSLLSEEDVLQETFTDAFLDINQFKPGSDSTFLAWLTTLATPNLLDAIRILEAAKRGGDVRRGGGEALARGGPYCTAGGASQASRTGTPISSGWTPQM